jgi:hypothetical protein
VINRIDPKDVHRPTSTCVTLSDLQASPRSPCPRCSPRRDWPPSSCCYQTVGTRSRISNLPGIVRWYRDKPATAAQGTAALRIKIEKVRWMILKPASFLKSTGAIANIVVLSFATFLGAAHSASEQKAGDGDVREVSSSPLSKISATIAEQYPSVRALALAQGNCVVFEYYRKDIDAETPSPAH